MPPRTKKSLGQHFLKDPRILARIADALEATTADTVVEIGPGLGGLTAALAERAGRVVAIEKDRSLVPGLRDRLRDGLLQVKPELDFPRSPKGKVFAQTG